MLGVGDGVHLVGGALQPQHWAFHFVEACLEAIPVAEIDRARPESAPALVSGVVGAVGFQPEVPFFVGDILAEAGAKDGDNEIVVYHPVVTDWRR